jgi:hypothetical protein
LAKYLYKAACSAAAGLTRPMIVTPVAWLSDTGASIDLIGRDYVDPILLEEMIEIIDKPIKLFTASSSVPKLDTKVRMQLAPIREDVEPIVVPSCPPLLSVGDRCMNHGWRFNWPPYQAHTWNQSFAHC